MQEKAYRETVKADRNTGRPGKDIDRWTGMVIYREAVKEICRAE